MATSGFFKDTEIHNVTTKSGTRRIGEGHRCSESDIILDQGPSAPLPSGIPTYTVVLCNACVSGCSITNIHLRCGWFSSARLIDPFVFRRLRFDDCLINDGKPLDAGQSLTFQYANTRSYPLSISSVVCV
ncbi:TPD1 protein homolog 1-like [Beta vulgaris subsp. vulgaris]|uniref:TPD1 protein homolog 1-like n=1 Tax=Beta vulgaris subsp. vulgaris TaxID=3555 RepID=UPI002547C9C0|nr:TPD1 protein homolog 1-like [Beta vulgaris subsp. vulgaris]